MGRLSDILTDPDKDVDGVDFPYDHGVVFRVARFGNPRFQQEMNKRVLQLKTWERKAALKGEGNSSDDAMRIAFGKHCLVGWKNLEDKAGDPIPYSTEYSVKLCRDPAFDAVFKDLLIFAQDPSEYREDALDEIAGNSPSSSSGN